MRQAVLTSQSMRCAGSEWWLRKSDGEGQDNFQRGREFGKEAEEWSGNSSEEQECGPRNTPK